LVLSAFIFYTMRPALCALRSALLPSKQVFIPTALFFLSKSATINIICVLSFLSNESKNPAGNALPEQSLNPVNLLIFIIMPPLTTVMDKEPESGFEFERLMKKLLIHDGSLKGYEFEPGATYREKGIDGMVKKNYPGIECPVIFQFKWLESPINKGDAARKIKESFGNLIKSGISLKRRLGDRRVGYPTCAKIPGLRLVSSPGHLAFRGQANWISAAGYYHFSRGNGNLPGRVRKGRQPAGYFR